MNKSAINFYSILSFSRHRLNFLSFVFFDDVTSVCFALFDSRSEVSHMSKMTRKLSSLPWSWIPLLVAKDWIKAEISIEKTRVKTVRKCAGWRAAVSATLSGIPSWSLPKSWRCSASTTSPLASGSSSSTSCSAHPDPSITSSNIR